MPRPKTGSECGLGQCCEQRRVGGLLKVVIVALAFACALACVPLWTPHAVADESPSESPSAETRTIRVAFVQQKPLLWMDESGASGYTYEYLERMAQYTGWNYELVPVDGEVPASYQTLRDLLEKDEVDIVAGLMSTPETRESFLLTHESFVTFETALLAPVDRAEDPIMAASAEKPLRVALAEASSLSSDLDEFCVQNGIPYERVACSSREEALEAARDGRADVAFSAGVAEAEGLRPVVHMMSHPVHFAVARENQALADELDGALDRIEQGDALFRSRLAETYLSSSTGQFSLRSDEKAFVATADPIRVGVLKDQPPYQYEEDGVLKGIAVDMLEAVAGKTGLRFQYVAAATVEELDSLQADGSIDMVAGVDYNYAEARERDLALTQPYATASYVLVANEGVADGEIAGKRLALVSSSRYEGSFVGDAHRFPSIASCLRAVFKGDADYTYVDEYVMQYFLNTPEFRNVRIAPQTYEPRRVSFGIVRSADDVLLGMIDRALGSLTDVERQAVINGNVLRERPFDPVEFVRANPAVAIACIAAGGLVVALFVLIVLAQRARGNAKMAVDLKKRLQLYALCDDRFFEYDRRTKTMLLSLPSVGGEGPREPLTIDCNGAAQFDEDCRREFFDVLEADEHRVVEMRMPNAEGEEHWLRVTVDPVNDASGRIAYSVGKIEVIDEERREKDQLVARAERDSLTGLLNSETTRLRTAQQLRALEADEQGALLVVDIDCFKGVNDTYGHLVGDRVLTDIASILRESFRMGDVVGRLGGDEFMVFLDRVSSPDAVLEKCDRLRRAIEQHVYSGTDCRATISVGMALAHAGDSFDDLYCRADEALYAAKRDGRNRCDIAVDVSPSPTS